MTVYRPLGLKWKALRLDSNGFGSDLARARKIEHRMYRLLGEWQGTKYSATQCVKGLWSYCTSFVCRYLDDLYRRPETPLPQIPHDVSFHNRDGAVSGLKWFLRHYPHAQKVEGIWVEPGDIILTAPEGGGPGHAITVGPVENELWQASGADGVHRTGMALPAPYLLHSVFRMADREVWA